MDRTLVEFFARHETCFNTGDLNAIAQDYLQPLAIFTDGQIILEHSREETLMKLFRVRAEGLKRGAVRLQLQILEEGKIENGRQPVLVGWHFVREDGGRIATTRVRYYLVADVMGRRRVEMLEYFEMAFPAAHAVPPKATEPLH